ncbi:MAG: CoA-binding protein, partial [Pseudomonas sp.]
MASGGGFVCAVYPVNPNENEILGLRCYRSVTDVPGPLDLIVVSLPGRAV